MPTKSNPIIINVLPRDKFDSKMFEHLENSENKVDRIYSDSKGIPTIGYGTALVVKGSNGKYALHERFIERLRTATGNPKLALTTEEKKRLDSSVVALNKGDSEKAKELIPQFNDQNIDSGNNKFSFKANSEGMKRVALGDLGRAKESVLNDIEVAAREQGKSPRQISAIRSQFENSEEMVGMASFKYNAGANAKMPKTATALMTGDRAEAAFEMMYRSNEEKNKGLAKRRVAEARFMTKSFSEDERKAYDKLVEDRANEVSDYQDKTGRKEGLFDEKKTDLSEDRVKLAADMGRDDGPMAEISLKPGADLTKSEVRQVMAERVDLPEGPQKDRLVRLEKEHFDGVYGTGPVQTDGAGRTIPPRAKIQTMEQPAPARATSGKTVGQAMARFGHKLATGNSDDNGIKTARDFQSGLNMIKGRATPSLFDKLKIDGQIGPKTRQAARTVLINLPSGSLENGLALGRCILAPAGALVALARPLEV